MRQRLGAMLGVIPFAPQSATAREIADALRGLGFRVTDRTVQRELVMLARHMPLRIDRTEKPFLWSWCSCPCGRTT